MRIVINHLTRMSGSRICIAGVDPERARHVRPTTSRNDVLTRRLLEESGGPLAIGALVDIGNPTPQPSPPESEDHRTTTRALQRVRVLNDNEYLAALESVREPNLQAAFGPELERREWKYASEPGHGSCSLAVIRPQRRPELAIDDRYGNLQVRLNDSDKPAYLSVTDLRFFGNDNRTLSEGIVDDAKRRLRAGVGVYLMFGLTRADPTAADYRGLHWLQVNGICLEDRPLGRYP